MSVQNVETTKKAYVAFGAGDLEMVMSLFGEAAEWIVNGESVIGGTYTGKGAIAELLGQVAKKLTRIEPKRYLNDGDFVVVLSELHFGTDVARQADVYAYENGRIVKARTFGDTALQERVFGRKPVTAG